MPDSTVVTAAAGWTFLVVGGAAYYYYAHGANSKLQRNRITSIKSTDPQRSRAKRADDRQNSASEGALSSNKQSEKAKNKQQKVNSNAPVRESPAIPLTSVEEKEDNSWAQELANKQKGTTFTKSKKLENRQKTVKQNNANKVAADMSGETSTTGADADDDLSPAMSPHLSSTEHTIPVSGDVKDMIETPAPGPNVLRITKPEEILPVSRKQNRAPKQEEVETKKQRQNRRKAEERKAEREEDEKIRRVQLEKQLRSAREARGEAARNGLASKPPVNNAWDKPQHDISSSVNANSNGELLETFEPEQKPVDNRAPSTNGSKTYEFNGRSLPSEEEQIRMIAENDPNSWTTVAKKDRKTRKNTADGSEGSENGGAVQPVEPPHIRTAKASDIKSNGIIASNGIH